MVNGWFGALWFGFCAIPLMKGIGFARSRPRIRKRQSKPPINHSYIVEEIESFLSKGIIATPP